MKLYHGILAESINQILSEGINPLSYWGDTFEALKYTNCNKLVEIDSDDYLIHPNQTLIGYHKEEASEEYDEWEQSNKGWEDSLKIFGSVMIEDLVRVDLSQIIIIE